MIPALSDIVRYFNRWRLVLSIFLIIYSVILLLDLSYMTIQWDETPHIYGGLLLSRGQFQEYTQAGSIYPPLFDIIIAFYFKILGSSVFSARLVALTFGVLTIWGVFEFAYRFYGPSNALLSSVLLASMPGFIWLSRIALIETMLIFFFAISLFLFFSWMCTKNDKMLLLSAIALSLGFLAKYQALVGCIVMFVSVFFLWRERILAKGKFLLILIIAGAVFFLWIFFTYQQHASGTLGTWLYVLQVGSEEKLAYSTRFPIPIFYLIEITYPYPDVHPISLPIYIFALLGIGIWLFKRRRVDKFSLIWFFVVYSVFTVITNKHWRYVMPVFPVLAISASDFILFIWNKATNYLRAHQISLNKKAIVKVATAILAFLVATSVLYSSRDAYLWIEKDHIGVPVKEASQYVADRAALNETIVVLCTSNLFNVNVMKFWLQIYDPNQRPLWSYPEKPVDVYTPILNVTELIEGCETLNAKYLLIYEYGFLPFYKSEMTFHEVFEMLLSTDRFVYEGVEFGEPHRRIFVISFSIS